MLFFDDTSAQFWAMSPCFRGFKTIMLLGGDKLSPKLKPNMDYRGISLNPAPRSKSLKYR
jgi:hypothetical protein